MELNTDNNYLNKFNSKLDITIDIADNKKSVIMGMLRQSIYTNPIESFVREIL